ncbi:MAG: N-formylglutamate amidohydrolase [Ignavibacteria bacterium]
MSRTGRPFAFVVTCEHARNAVPSRYRGCFAGNEAALQSHHGYDAGALEMARALARALEAPLFDAQVSRLLVDVNRSPGHPRLYSEAVRQLPAQARGEIREAYYEPIRAQAEQAIRQAASAGKRVVHLSSHSFTPMLDGVERTADVGLLYDPKRVGEVALCKHWQRELAERLPDLRVRRNYPYRGTSDGFTAYLRRRLSGARYVGVELEINQRIMTAGGVAWRTLRRTLIAALQAALAAEDATRA